MKRLLLALSASTCLPVMAGTASYTFSGVTTSNVVDAGAITTEFPVGTKWSAQVEWDTAAAALDVFDNQSTYRLTRFTLSFKGKTGVWTTSSVVDKASFGLNMLAQDEIQFTSGWGPTQHTNQTIANWQPYSANIVLQDPSGTVIPALTPAPKSIDFSKWDPAKSYFKIYLNNDGNRYIYGNIQSVSSANDPEISIQQPAGSELADGKDKKSFGTVKLGKKSTSKVFTVKNTGGVTLKSLAVKISGSHKADFIVTAPAKTSLAPGASTTFKVAFKPSAKGTRSAALAVTSSDKNESPFDIKVTGLGAK